MINTIEISTTFLKPVPENCKYCITVTANHIGRTITSMTAEARSSETKLLFSNCFYLFYEIRTKICRYIT